MNFSNPGSAKHRNNSFISSGERGRTLCLTAYGRRNLRERSEISQPRSLTDISNEEVGGKMTTGVPWGFYVLIGLGGLALLFVIVHLAGGGLVQHGN